MDRWGVRLFLIVDLTTALSKLVLLLSIFFITCSRTLGARHVIFNTLFLYLGGSGITFKEYACEFYGTYLIPFLSLYPLLLTTYTKFLLMLVLSLILRRLGDPPVQRAYYSAATHSHSSYYC